MTLKAIKGAKTELLKLQDKEKINRQGELQNF